MSSTGSTTSRSPTARCSTSTCLRARPTRVEVARLGKRIYRDALEQVDSDEEGRRRYRIYGDSPVHDDEAGTDLAAVAAGRIAVTPLHFDLTAEHGLDELRAYDLARLLAPAAEEVGESAGADSLASSLREHRGEVAE